VKDFQVAFGLDTDGDGVIDGWMSQPPSTAEDVRNQVKELRVYIIYQEGQLLDHEVSTQNISLGSEEDISLSTFTPSDGGSLGKCTPSNERCYRWKTLKLSVRPLNLGR